MVTFHSRCSKLKWCDLAAHKRCVYANIYYSSFSADKRLARSGASTDRSPYYRRQPSAPNTVRRASLLRRSWLKLYHTYLTLLLCILVSRGQRYHAANLAASSPYLVASLFQENCHLGLASSDSVNLLHSSSRGHSVSSLAISPQSRGEIICSS